MARQILGVFLVFKLLRSEDVVPVQSLSSRNRGAACPGFIGNGSGSVETRLAVRLVNQWALHTEFHPRLALSAVIIGRLLLLLTMVAAAAGPL